MATDEPSKVSYLISSPKKISLNSLNCLSRRPNTYVSRRRKSSRRKRHDQTAAATWRYIIFPG